MIKVLEIISKITKVIFYALILFFIGVLVSILSGYFKFTDSQIPFYYTIGMAGVGFISLLLADIVTLLKKKKNVSVLIPEETVVLTDNSEMTAEPEITVEEKNNDEPLA